MPARPEMRFAPLPLALAAVFVFGIADAAPRFPLTATDSPIFRQTARARAARAVRLAPHAATPTTPTGALLVSSCDDDGSDGTLRSVIGNAPSGVTIDLSELACSTITLTQGAIAFDVDDLALHGPSDHVLAIDGGGGDAVLAGYGGGTLAIDHLAIVDGYYAGGTAPAGGCIYSHGTVTLDTSTVSGCSVGHSGAPGYGGGVFAYTGITVTSSTISGNATTQIGGGLFSFGPIHVTNSTVSGNTSDSVGAGIAAISTVGIYASTIAFNAAPFGGSGLFVSFNSPPVLYSTIIADNTRTQTSYYAADIGSPFTTTTITGGGNIVQFSDMPLPGGTITSDPLLLPLAANGGPTLTHALQPTSPAIGGGNNVAMLQFDQRGDPFTRVYGDEADIGAFELQPLADAIFANGFDSR